MSVKEIKSVWDMPETNGYYWAFDSLLNKWFITQFLDNGFYTFHTYETNDNVYNKLPGKVTKYKKILKPKN